ncbi:MAG TPA: hypothetical protein VLK36_03430 [Gaiellaceae bacterium]|nr:hypothetical protein [Gaiellaceae bacterium]
MVPDGSWTWLPVSLLFGAPWIAGIIWVCLRTRGRDHVPPSLAEMASRRLWPH